MVGALYSIAVGLNSQSRHLNIHAHMGIYGWLRLILDSASRRLLDAVSKFLTVLCSSSSNRQEPFKAVNRLRQRQICLQGLPQLQALCFPHHKVLLLSV